jgi:hypothetical protein
MTHNERRPEDGRAQWFDPGRERAVIDIDRGEALPLRNGGGTVRHAE